MGDSQIMTSRSMELNLGSIERSNAEETKVPRMFLHQVNLWVDPCGSLMKQSCRNWLVLCDIVFLSVALKVKYYSAPEVYR